jgi:cation:H+ antiporter
MQERYCSSRAGSARSCLPPGDDLGRYERDRTVPPSELRAKLPVNRPVSLPLPEPVGGVLLFVVGVVLVIWATERLLEGLVGLAVAVHLRTFTIAALLSGFEAENVAVGLAAGGRGLAPVALGSVFGGAIFLMCVALGLGAMLYPLRVFLPRTVLVVLAVAPLVAGLALLGDTTPRLAGALLLASFGLLMGIVVRAAQQQPFLDADEIEEATEKTHRWPAAVGLTLLGVAVIGLGGELVASGAEQMIRSLGVPAAFMGMVVTPAAIELEEVVRQAVPTRAGHPEMSAGNLVGTLLYFALFNLGLIALLTPVYVDARVRSLDWPVLVGTTWLATAFLSRGRVGRAEGCVLLAAYGLYVVAQVVAVTGAPAHAP